MKIQYINACKFLRINKYSSFLVFGFFNYIINFPEIQIIYLLSKTHCFLSHCSPLEWISLDLISCTQQLMQMDIWKTAQVRACGWLQHVRHLLSGRGKRLSNSYVTALMKFFLLYFSVTYINFKSYSGQKYQHLFLHFFITVMNQAHYPYFSAEITENER